MTRRHLISGGLLVLLCACASSETNSDTSSIPETTPIVADVAADSPPPQDTDTPDLLPPEDINDTVDGNGDTAEDTIPPGNSIGGPCAQNEDCTSNFCYTHPANGYCTALCSPDQPCPEGSLCLQASSGDLSICYTTCEEEEDCLEKQHCEFANGSCQPDCKPSDCTFGFECNFESGLCEPPQICEPSEEICNGVDDDCDALVDEGCTQPPDLPNGVGWIDLGLMPAGGGIFQPVEFSIPSGTGSFMMVALAEDEEYMTLVSFIDPQSTQLTNAENPFDSINPSTPSQGAHTTLVPNAPASYQVVPGTHHVQLYKEGQYSLIPLMIFTKGPEEISTVDMWHFDDGSLQGWSQLLTSSSGATQWEPDTHPSTQDAVTSAYPWEERDNPHSTLLLRSPAFALSPGDALSLSLAGGRGANVLPRQQTADNPIASSNDGYMGVVLRRVSDDTYLLSIRRPAKNNDGFRTLTADPDFLTEIIADDAPGETYTLDLIDEYDGGWGWLAMGNARVLKHPLKLDLNLFFVGTPGLNAGNFETHETFPAVMDAFWDIYGQANIIPGAVTGYDITGDAAQIYTYLDKAINGPGELPELLALSANVANPWALNFFFVQDITGIDSFATLGIAGGIPGPPSTPGTGSSGVAVSMVSFYENTGNKAAVGIYRTAQTMAHESGHFLGLFHVSEQPATYHDPLLDTPECSDEDGDGLGYAGECPGEAAQNMMFWHANGCTQFSEEQIRVLRSNVQVYAP